MNDAAIADTTCPTPAPSWRYACAGTEASTEGPCEAPATTEVDGLPLCGLHADEFWAEAWADVLEVAALYLSRWLRVAREELCNDELVRRLEAAREGVETETEHALAGLGRASGPWRAPLRQTGLEGRGDDPRLPEGVGTSSTASTENAAGFRRDRGACGRLGDCQDRRR